MIKTLSRTQDTILVVDDAGNVKTARADHPKWKELTDLLSRITYIPISDEFSGPVDAFLATMDLKTVIETYTVGLLSINALGVTYAGRPIHTIDVERLLAFIREKRDYHPIANYVARKMQNPSARAIKEMYAFLENKGMPLTLKGTFIAYKGIGPDDWSIQGNKDTVVLQGEVNESGHIKNTIGATIEVERSSVDDDFRNGCSTGLHVGSLEYARGWGKKVVYVEVDPADVVSVPSDCSCQKLRCCKYTVVGECTGLLSNTYTNEFDPKADSDEPNICHQCGGPVDNCDCQDKENTVVCDKCGEYVDMCLCNSEAEPAAMANALAPLPNEPCNCGHCQHEQKTTTEPPSLTYIRVINLIAEKFNVKAENICPDQTLFDLGADSLDEVELIIAFEDEFDIEISDDMAEKHANSTISQIVKSIELRVGLSKLSVPNSNVYPIAENPNSYNEGVVDGKKDRVIDRGMNLFNPKYLPDDVNGADSKAHVDYIHGYVFGYGQ